MEKKIVIAGSGFAGLQTALNIRKKDKEVSLTVVSKYNKFVFLPALFEFVSGKRKEKEITIELKNFLKKKKINFVQDTVIGLDSKKNILLTKKGFLEFNVLIIALGGMPWHFNVPGVKKHSIMLYSLESAKKIKKRIEKILSIHKKARILVCGAGFNGIETTSEISYYCKKKGEKSVEVCICEAAENVLPFAPSKVSSIVKNDLKQKKIKIKCGLKIKKIEKQKIITSKGKIKANIIIWSAGIKPNKTVFKFGLETSRNGLIVNKKLQTSKKNIFALGDCADYNCFKQKIPKTAQTALHEAGTVAKNALNFLKSKKLEEFKPKNIYPQVASLGDKGLFVYGGLAFKGRIPGLMKYLIEKKFFVDCFF